MRGGGQVDPSEGNRWRNFIISSHSLGAAHKVGSSRDIGSRVQVAGCWWVALSVGWWVATEGGQDKEMDSPLSHQLPAGWFRWRSPLPVHPPPSWRVPSPSARRLSVPRVSCLKGDADSSGHWQFPSCVVVIRLWASHSAGLPHASDTTFFVCFVFSFDLFDLAGPFFQLFHRSWRR